VWGGLSLSIDGLSVSAQRIRIGGL
jgi:hypothetical protein